MDEAGFASAHVAGNSLGGWIALILARRGRARTVTAISPAGLAHARERTFGRSVLLGLRWVHAQRAAAGAPPAQPRGPNAAGGADTRPALARRPR